MISDLKKILDNKHVLILGFGIEGRSTYAVLSSILKPEFIGLADQNKVVFTEELCKKHNAYWGDGYLKDHINYDVIIKSPGISESSLPIDLDLSKVTSQTNLFLSAFASQTIGVTGTKGKSTTSSLIHQIISKHTTNSLLVGNIGKPPFDFIERINDKTILIYEMSAHQLADIKVSPAIAIILNIFEEHLDHHRTFDKYIQAKLNIGKFQKAGDYLIINGDDPILGSAFQNTARTGLMRYKMKSHEQDGAYLASDQKVIFQDPGRIHEFDFSNRVGLPGNHNLKNIMAAVCACKLIQISDDLIVKGVLEFKGLEHRLEYVGEFGSIHFYNDSISTVPEATMAAIQTLGDLDTLILGGKDRGIDYKALVTFLENSPVRNIIFTGPAGARMMSAFKGQNNSQQNLFFVERFIEIETIIKEYTSPGGVCLLSPAASSYDQFKNFEERGNAFKKIAGNLSFPAS